MAITINQEQGLYVIPSGSGFSCWGFQNADDEARELHRRTGGAVPAPTATPGAVDHYEECRAIISAYGKLGRDETHYSYRTPDAVRRTLDRLIGTGTRVRIWCGDTESGVAWSEEYDIIGTIGRSMGPLKTPLLISSRRSMGGSAILTDCIVAIEASPTVTLYRHPRFFAGDWTHSGCEVARDGDLYARCKSVDAAKRLRDFMGGRRWAK
jgi:hypothetical protein